MKGEYNMLKCKNCDQHITTGSRVNVSHRNYCKACGALVVFTNLRHTFLEGKVSYETVIGSSTAMIDMTSEYVIPSMMEYFSRVHNRFCGMFERYIQEALSTQSFNLGEFAYSLGECFNSVSNAANCESLAAVFRS